MTTTATPHATTAGIAALASAPAVRRDELARRFAAARPFPHVVLDDVVPTADTDDLLASFPAAENPGWHRFGDAYQAHKATFRDLDALSGPVRDLLWALNGPGFLRFLEDVTGVPALVPDPHLTGGGLHVSGPGGVLAPHSDFHLYPRLGLFRRVNVIVYLNPGWQDEWGGALELYGDAYATELVARVPAQWGRMVVFRTDLDSVHGFSEPVPAGVTRRSVATYYYTAQEAEGYSGDGSTLWRTHEAATRAERAQLTGYRTLLKASTGLSYAAHALNPTLRRAAVAKVRSRHRDRWR